VEIKIVTGEHLEAYRHIVSHSFERGRACEISAEDLEARERFGVFEGGRLQASLRILDFQMFFGRERRPCGGIAGVACEPAARGRGYAGALLVHSLEVMKERGQYLSSLWPFSFAYYRRYGWEWVGPGRWYKVPLAVIPPQDESKYVEAFSGGVEAELNPVYEEFATRYNGMLARGAKRWQSFERVWAGKSHATFAYRREGRIEGYAKVKYGEKEEEAEATEVVAATPRAYRGLLGVFRRYGMTVKSMKWKGAPDDPLWSVVCDWDIDTRLEPEGMSRIVDLKAALEALRPDSGIVGACRVAVTDEKAPWNSGTWRIEADSGSVSSAPDSGDAGVSLDIQALTQAYWGSPSLETLRKWGRVAVHQEGAFHTLRALLPEAQVLLMDDF
jgi:predicted acetyltransferase